MPDASMMPVASTAREEARPPDRLQAITTHLIPVLIPLATHSEFGPIHDCGSLVQGVSSIYMAAVDLVRKSLTQMRPLGSVMSFRAIVDLLSACSRTALSYRHRPGPDHVTSVTKIAQHILCAATNEDVRLKASFPAVPKSAHCREQRQADFVHES
jgi:hypothetical protein